MLTPNLDKHIEKIADRITKNLELSMPNMSDHERNTELLLLAQAIRQDVRNLPQPIV